MRAAINIRIDRMNTSASFSVVIECIELNVYTLKYYNSNLRGLVFWIYVWVLEEMLLKCSYYMNSIFKNLIWKECISLSLLVATHICSAVK